MPREVFGRDGVDWREGARSLETRVVRYEHGTDRRAPLREREEDRHDPSRQRLEAHGFRLSMARLRSPLVVSRTAESDPGAQGVDPYLIPRVAN